MNNNKSILSYVIATVFVLLSGVATSSQAAESITVKPGQTLIKIMRNVYADQRSRWPSLMREIVTLNPHAFENGDPRTLKPGVELKLPESGTQKKVAQQKSRAGTLKSIEGSITVIDTERKARSVKAGETLYVGEQLISGESGKATLSMIDGASLELRCNSVLSIDEYKMRTSGSHSIVTLVKGSVAAESGRIGRRAADVYELRTPHATITTESADYGVRVQQQRACQKQDDVENDGLYLSVLAGGVTVQNAQGVLKVSAGDAARVSSKTTAPAAFQGFAGMVFGEKPVATAMPEVVQPEVKQPPAESSEAEEVVDNGTPLWWMIAGLAVLGIMF